VRRTAAVVVSLFAGGALLAACGDDDGGGSAVLDEADQAVLQEELDAYGTELLNEHGELGHGGLSYSPADGNVTGYGSDVIDPVEKCQRYADRIGTLDGPPATVPIQIISMHDDGRGFDVLAEGTGGGTCETG